MIKYWRKSHDKENNSPKSKFAEENVAVPELPAEWWNNVTQHYGNFDET